MNFQIPGNRRHWSSELRESQEFILKIIFDSEFRILIPILQILIPNSDQNQNNGRSKFQIFFFICFARPNNQGSGNHATKTNKDDQTENQNNKIEAALDDDDTTTTTNDAVPIATQPKRTMATTTTKAAMPRRWQSITKNNAAPPS